ncbi:MAG: hypothetical protein PHD82_17135 [Candidatus Riflebacteria bacterium]|nr:hypothetical protein [Candidatus Riflebacteria bacterium]
MVRPLYPLRNPPGRPAPAPAAPLWKNPYLLGAASIVALLVVIFFWHVSRSGIINPEAVPDGADHGVFSFLKPSKYFKGKPRDLAAHQQQLVKMGIASQSESLSRKIEAKDLREERRILAIQKYEASRETAARFQQEREELRRRLQSPTSLQLKDAVLALEDSDNLGIMKLERLLEEKLLSQGAAGEDLDALVYAYDRLAKVYENKNMQEKAKEAYVNVFRLMKRRAPDTQGPDWDGAIGNVEQLRVKSPGN